jgi:hypothetical protein
VRESQVQLLSAEDVLKRVSLLKRVVRDLCSNHETRRKSKERMEELLVISRKFSSVEIQETINNLRRQITDCDRDIEACEKEVRAMGGVLKDSRRGLVYFHSEREKRRIYLVWDLRQADGISWHELDESFADRSPVEFPKGAIAKALDRPE